MGSTPRLTEPAPARRQWPLAVFLTLRFAVVAVIAVTASSLIIGLSIVPTVKQDIEEHNQSLSAAMVAQVESYFAVADRELRAMTILLSADYGAGRNIDALLDSYVSASSFYEAIYLVDDKGQVRSIGLPIDMRVSRQNYLGLDVSHRPFVVDAWRHNNPIWSSSFLSPVTGRPAIALALPMGRGVLVGEVAVTPLPELARRLTVNTSLRVMILDSQNQLVAHSANAYAGQQMNLGHLGIVGDVRSGIPSRQTAFEFDGEHLIGSASLVADLHWLVITAQPEYEATARLRTIWSEFGTAILLAAISALWAAVWTANLLTRRFLNFNLQAEKIAGGDYQLAWEDMRVREFTELRHRLQAMAKAIQEREAGMRAAQASMVELNTTLENRVAERTDKLQSANDELVATLETLQKAQDELLRAEKLASLGSMVAGIAHELNTPIGNAVMVASTLADHSRELAREIESGVLRRSTLERYLNDYQNAADILLRNLQRSSELIKSFKQVAVDQTSQQRRIFRLEEIVDEIKLALYPMLKKTPFVIRTEGVALDAWLDSYPGPLGQVLTNLIENAVRHAFDGRSSGTILIRGHLLGEDRVELFVEDDGRGIPVEHLDKIFDPFFTTKLGHGGSGLGLNIVHSLVTRVLGGSITVSSQPDAGTQMRILLPLKAPHHPDSL